MSAETKNHFRHTTKTQQDNRLQYSQAPRIQTSSFLGFPAAYTHIRETVRKNAAGSAPLGRLPAFK